MKGRGGVGEEGKGSQVVDESWERESALRFTTSRKYMD